ncbi:NUDIX hydrolase [Nesterenkonia sp. CF4.4]|uniref:NUDIX hydrolase n=1 Tax=Nesterenkonia sp. CF4.4 TaxID=3373079 RepID=UPI003EE778CF
MRDADSNPLRPGAPDAEAPAGFSLTGAAFPTRLEALLQQGRDYALEHPESAGSGGWWNQRPATTAPRKTPAGMENARQAAVLMLFCAPTPDDDEAHLLLTERSPGLKKHPGQISFPGGAQEKSDRDPSAAAVREAQEEVGLDPGRVRVLGTLPPAPVPISGFMVTPVIAMAGHTGLLRPQSGEVERVLPVRLDALIRPENRRMTVLRRAGTVFKAPAFLVDGTLIWGFTGILVDRVINRLGWEEPWDAGRNVDPGDYLPGL